MVNTKKVINVVITRDTTGSQNNTITINPTQSIEIHAAGNGFLVITFSNNIPSELQQFAVSPNSVKIPVIGELDMSLSNVTSILPEGVLNLKIEESPNGIIPKPVKLPKIFEHTIFVQVSNGSLTNAIVKGSQIQNLNIIPVGKDPFVIVGQGVSFTIQDYDPITQMPVSPSIFVNLPSSTTTEFEFPSGSTIIASRTGVIMMSNITGTGYFYIFPAHQ
jgi:hypothetical protein